MINIKNFQSFINQIAEEKGLEQQVVAGGLADALALAYKKDYAHRDDRVEAIVDERSGKVRYEAVKSVVTPEELADGEARLNSHKYVTPEEVIAIQPGAKPGDEIRTELPYQEAFSRIAAQTAKQVIFQKLKEIEKGVIFERFKDREGSIITGTIQKIDPRAIYVDLGRTTGVLFRTETIPGEIYRVQSRLRFYVYAVETTMRGVEVFLSRSHPLFIAAIFRMEVPEISEGIVEVKGVARMPGTRTKLAVHSTIEGIDPVGACIGPRGSRIISIMNELNNEKIDIIPWAEDPIQFVMNALLPAKVTEAQVLEKHTIKALVTEDQIPIALGKGGQNIKLASRLTGWKIDVRLLGAPETAAGEDSETIVEPKSELETDEVTGDASTEPAGDMVEANE